jgi:hypothetical protein
MLILLIALIAISRLYLGVHYPNDVLMGLLAGSILVWLLVRFEKPVLDWFLSQKLWSQITVLLGAVLLLVAFGFAALQLQKNIPVPEAWLAQIQEADPGNTGHPYNLEGMISSSGTLFGIMLGSVFLFRRGGLKKSTGLQQAVLRYLTGTIVLVLLYVSLRMLHFDNHWADNIYRFLRYSILGFWVSCGAPLIFERLKLAEQPDSGTAG